MIGILRYNAGNGMSVANALGRLGIDAQTVETASQIAGCDGLILPGAGAAHSIMRDLCERGLVDALRTFRKPFLGICLGMQLLFDFSEEGSVDCLGIVRGRVKALPDDVTKPHMGWNQLDTGHYAYFVHSYYCVPDDPRIVTTTARHGVNFCAGIRQQNFFGVQWHPEKSGETGDLLLGAFASLCEERWPAEKGISPIYAQHPKGSSGKLDLSPFSPAMQVIPAIDVLDGKVVRLVQGDFARVTVFGNDPLEIAEGYRLAGASRLHLVNLSAARDGESNAAFLELVAKISRRMEVQVGGGVRDFAAIARNLEAGAAAVVIGTMLFTQPEAVRSAVALFGQRSIIAALDTDGGEVKIRGWQEGSGQSLAEAMQRIEELGIRNVLMTDIARDGAGTGPNVALYAEWARRSPDVRITASGGVRGANDICALDTAGCDAVVVGRALLDNSVSLPALLGACDAAVPAANGRRDACTTNLAVRVIPCLDVTNGRVVKGTNFQNLRDAGDPVELARRYCDEGADELVFLDITATSDRRRTVAELASRVADAVNIPFTIGGGVRNIADARTLLDAGADKVAVNSAAIADPSLLEAMARELGSANVVCAIDARRKNDAWTVLVRGGRDDAGIDAIAWAEEAVARGAGELLVTSHDRDGTGEGFDILLLSEIKKRVSVPVIASGGGGSLGSFIEAVRDGEADAVLAASVFHFGTFSIRDVKNALHNAYFPVRP